MSSYTGIWAAFTIAMSSPAAIAWYRNAEWIAWRTRSFPRKLNDRFETPPETFAPGQRSLISRGLDERLRELAVLLHPGRDRQDVGVEDDVRGLVAGLVDQQPVRALADLDLAVDRVGLALLVERHHDDRRAVALDPPGLLQEVLLALLQADRVHDALALHALQAGLDHRPLRAVDHDRHARDLGLGGDRGSGTWSSPSRRRAGRRPCSRRAGSRRSAPARAATSTARLVVARLDQAAELRRAGDVLALADHHEPGVGRDRRTARGR